MDARDRKGLRRLPGGGRPRPAWMDVLSLFAGAGFMLLFVPADARRAFAVPLGAVVVFGLVNLVVSRRGTARRAAGEAAAEEDGEATAPPPVRGPGAAAAALRGLPGERRRRAVWAALAGVLVFGAASGFEVRAAVGEHRTVEGLRQRGRTAVATVVEVTDRSEDGYALSATVRFDTPSGPVLADLDLAADDPPLARDFPGRIVAVVYDPGHPARARTARDLGHDTWDGNVQGAVVFGLVAAGFLVGGLVGAARGGRPGPEAEAAPPPGPEGRRPS
ncbi:hypothetical protein LO771_01315 [Streptacidiphilus sp. ASG 303]|uniref:DUF3592 domain-containing protein n=1 Tax=Streptacidiphilus sp. ASG 303 TaxID=2896847 RepID=UPI001E4D5DA8|nr:DUF3592 domain-containing protein [Streptacidiphilus sp. ASG 303]MCD0481085.1 hypothetical protein [Streptacidiphilus sp. ASG 303]